LHRRIAQAIRNTMQIGTLLPSGIHSVARRAVLVKLPLAVFEIGGRLRSLRSGRGLLGRRFLTCGLSNASRI
jgi:hypothetical protein